VRNSSNQSEAIATATADVEIRSSKGLTPAGAGSWMVARVTRGLFRV